MSSTEPHSTVTSSPPALLTLHPTAAHCPPNTTSSQLSPQPGSTFVTAPPPPVQADCLTLFFLGGGQKDR